MFRFPPIPCLVSLALALLAGGLPARAEFTVSGRRILKDGVAFTIKGVCYNPTPIGENGSRAPNGDYFTSQYSALWDRDLPQLRAMGANVLRIYGWNPTADHSAFLDRCYNGGDRPLYVLVNYWVDPLTAWTNLSAVQALTANFTTIERRLGAHPAVLGLIVGNEVNAQNGNGGKTEFWTAMNNVAGAVKAVNGKRLVTIAITDSITQLAAAESKMTKIDFWCMQLYRGLSFGSFFNDFAARSSRPVVISEYGFDAFNYRTNLPYPDKGAYPALVVTNLWLEIVKASAVCAGGCIFEYCDEWFRAPGGTDFTQDRGGWVAPGFPDGQADEDWWGLFSIAANGSGPNTLTPRAAYEELSAVWNSLPPTLPPAPATDSVLDGGFESVRVGSNTFNAFAYSPAMTGWTFAGGAGVTGNNSGFTSANTVAPEGTQVAFVQTLGAATVSVVMAAGSYQVSALTARRMNYGGQQTVSVRVDGVEVGRLLGGTTYTLSTTPSFTVAAGAHNIAFVGLALGDATLLLDQVTIKASSTVRPVKSPGFESPHVGSNIFNAFVYNPATVPGVQDWTFAGKSGVTGNGSGFTLTNSLAPEGRQVAFIQSNTGALSQLVNLPTTGTYLLSVSAAQRANWNQSRQVVQVYLDTALVGSIVPGGTSYQTTVLSVSAIAGGHLLRFVGTTPDDSTALLDLISLSPASSQP